MLARDHEQVTARRRVDVHERDRALVLAHARRGDLAGDDLAEQAVGVAHRRTRVSRSAAHGRGRPALASPAMPPDPNRLRAVVEHLQAIDRPSGLRGRARGGRVAARPLRRARARRRGSRRSRRRARSPSRWRCCARSAPRPGSRAARGRSPPRPGSPRRPRSPTTSPPARTSFRRLLAAPHDAQRASPRRATRTASETVVFVAHHDAAHGRPDLPPRPDPLGRRPVPGLVRAPGDVAAADAARRRRPGARRARRAAGPPRRRAGSAACWRSARRSRSATSPRARSCPAPTTTSPRSPCSSSSRGCWARSRPTGVRVLLLSTGGEESFMEGMRGFVARHARRAGPRAHALRRPRVRRRPRGDRARGRGHAADARLHARDARLARRVRRARRAPAAPRAALRLRHRRADRAQGRLPDRACWPRSTRTRWPRTTTRRATWPRTSTSARSPPTTAVCLEAVRSLSRAASSRARAIASSRVAIAPA